MDAVTFANSIKNDPALAGTKLLVMTGDDSPMDASTSVALGFTGCVGKPPKPDELYERLASLIEPPNVRQPHAA
jgi:CheY-like chemotaxis protein